MKDMTLDELHRVGMQPTATCPEDGYMQYCEAFGCNVGVWIMPDNLHQGSLEDFLVELIPAGPLFSHAQASTAQALEHGARFIAAHRIKAELHAWLAWQPEPGNPYGTALRARYFGQTSLSADRFVRWFDRLFGDVLPSACQRDARSHF